MSMLPQMVVSGVVMGSIYALIAVGFVLIYNTISLPNFAQGDFVMIGAFVGVWAVTTLKTGPVWEVIFSLFAMGAIGFLIYQIVFRPLLGKSFLLTLISTAALGMFLQELARLVWGPIPLSHPPFLSGPVIRIGDVSIPRHNLLIVFVAFLVIWGVHLFLSKTSIGRILRAVAQDREAAQMMGIKVERVSGWAVAIGSAASGLAGVLLVPLLNANTAMGVPLMLKVFAAVVIGGFGSLPGAIAGGLLLGITEVLAAGYISSLYRDAYAFLFLIAVLLFFPRGVFGEEISEKL